MGVVKLTIIRRDQWLQWRAYFVYDQRPLSCFCLLFPAERHLSGSTHRDRKTPAVASIVSLPQKCAITIAFVVGLE